MLVQRLGLRAAGDGPAFRALAGSIAEAVQRGDVPGATLLPAERALAAALGVSRGTVVAAYDLLREDGVVLRRQGSGTWVRSAEANDGLVDAAEQDAAVRARRLSARVVDPVAEVIDLGLSVLAAPFGLDDDHLGATVDELVEVGGAHGYLPNGLPALRERLAERCTQAGLPTAPEQVAITHGAQHSIELAARLLVHPGDTVALESPTFPGAIDAFSRAGARFTTVGLDSGGTRIDDLDRVLAADDVRALYLVPTCHSATGSVMASHRRRELAERIDRSETWLIEDEALAPLRFAAPPPPSVASQCRTERHVLLGSLSKQVWAGLRVGWLRADAGLVGRLARLRAASDLGGSVQAQLVALRCLDGLDERTAALRRVLDARAQHLAHGLARELPDWRVHTPDGGLSIWCTLPLSVADELSACAPAHGVSVLPGSATSADDTFADHVRLSFALPPEVLDDGLVRLRAAWEQVVGRTSARTGGAR
jgi:DNA-binding transcriptional MocR family regulator